MRLRAKSCLINFYSFAKNTNFLVKKKIATITPKIYYSRTARIVVLIVLPVIAAWLIYPGASPKIIELKNGDFFYKFVPLVESNVKIDSFDKTRIIVSELLDSTFPLSWYEVCLNNKVRIVEGEKAKDPDEFKGHVGELYLYLLPANTNTTLNSQQDTLMSLNNRATDETLERRIISETKLMAKSGQVDCAFFRASEGGFYYRGPLVKLTEDGKVSVGENVALGDQYPDLKDSRIELKVGLALLWPRRVLLILIFDGFLFVLVKIVKTVFCSRRMEKTKISVS